MTQELGNKMMLHDVATVSLNEKQEGTLETDEMSILLSNQEYENKPIDIDNDNVLYDILYNNKNNNIINNELSLIIKIKKDTLEEFRKQVLQDYDRTQVALNDKINELIRTWTKQHHATSSLLYDGRTPRKDVLVKLRDICYSMTNYETHPRFSKTTIEKIITKTLGSLDSRTMIKYLKCFKHFSEQKTGQTMTYHSMYDLEGFSKVVVEKLNQLEMGDDKCPS